MLAQMPESMVHPFLYKRACDVIGIGRREAAAACLAKLFRSFSGHCFWHRSSELWLIQKFDRPILLAISSRLSGSAGLAGCGQWYGFSVVALVIFLVVALGFEVRCLECSEKLAVRELISSGL